MRARALALAGAAFLTVSAATAQDADNDWLRRCNRDGWNDREQFCEVRVSGFRPGRGTVQVQPGMNGGVSIIGWQRDSIEVHARIRGSAYEMREARSIANAVEVGRSGNTIAAEGPETNRGEGWSVEFVVYIPHNSNLNIETHNGPLAVRGVTGRMDLSSQNGPLALSDVGGDVRARTQNGPLSVRLSGSRWEGEGLDAETSNGPATLHIPENYSAQLETGTTNGPFESDIPLTVTFRGRMPRELNTTLGRGGAPIRVVTTNGPLSLRRF
jgi:DUF4097 and DUF4098 domain-containing protein YvlB